MQKRIVVVVWICCLLALGQATCRGDDAINVAIRFDEASQSVVTTVTNRSLWSRGISPRFDVEHRVPQWLWVIYSPFGPRDARLSRWNPVLMSSDSMIHTPVKLFRIKGRATEERVVQAVPVIQFIEKIRVLGVRDGMWLKFQASFMTDKNAEKWVSAETEWLCYSQDRILKVEEEKAAQPGATDNPDDAQRVREDH